MENSEEKKRILIIDDEPDLIDVMMPRLEDLGYVVDGQTDPVEGRRSAMKHRPDLIILDIYIPGWNGLELMQSLLHLPNLTDVPILIYTAHKEAEDEAIARKQGAAGYFTKGLDDAKLINTIKQLLP